MPLDVAGDLPGQQRGVVLGALLVGGVLLTYLLPLFAPSSDPAGMRLDRTDEPDLWRSVDDLAAATESATPEELRLSGSGQAGVTTRRRLRRLHRGQRTLWLGLPLLTGLDVEQLRAVVAHELTQLVRHSGWLDRQVERDGRSLSRLAVTCSPVPLLAQVVLVYGTTWALLATPRLRRQDSRPTPSPPEWWGRKSSPPPWCGATTSPTSGRASSRASCGPP